MTLTTVLMLLAGANASFNLSLSHAQNAGGACAVFPASDLTLTVAAEFAAAEVDIWVAPVRQDGFVEIDAVQRLAVVTVGDAEADLALEIPDSLAGTSWLLVATTTDARGRFQHSVPKVVHVMDPRVDPLPFPWPTIEPTSGVIQIR